MTNRSLAVVGAGVAGIGAANALRDADVEVTMFEKSRGVGGRAATRRQYGCRYDHGANYLKSPDERTDDLVRSLGTDGLVDIEKPIWTHDASGTISEGDSRDDHTWTYERGITQLSKRLLARTDATLHEETRVGGIESVDDGWRLESVGGDALGTFDALLLTPPAAQTADLLATVESPGNDLAALRDAVATVPFRTIQTLVLRYPFDLDVPYYALVNADGEHPVGWVSREECKPGHVPDGSLLIAQMAPDWSAERYDDPAEDVASAAADVVADLLDDERLRDPEWTDRQGWRYALPDEGIDEGATRAVESAGLFVAGDWVAGEGRIHEALWNGVGAGERIAEHLDAN